MATCQDIERRLSPYVDGELAPDDRADVDRHLTACTRCRGVVRDLERIRRTAGALGPMTPPDHIWLEVAGQLRPAGLGGRVREAVSGSPGAWRQWLGLAAMLVVATLATYFATRAPGDVAPDPSGNVAAPGTVQAVTDELTRAMQHYENAIGQLEALAAKSDGPVDPALAAVLRQNIETIDSQIAESRAAVSQDPDSVPARESLFEALKSKVGVLQATLSLMNEMARGDQAAAAEAAAAFGKKG